MSADVVVCPRCGTNLQNSVGVAGQVVACPNCHTPLQMPVLSQSAAVAPPIPQPPIPQPPIPQPPIPQLPIPQPPIPQLPIPQLPIASTLPPAIEPAPVGAASAVGPIVSSQPRRREAAASVTDRLRKRSSPWPIVVTVILVSLVIVVGTVSYLGKQAEAARRELERQLVGNWELVPGQSPLERWDCAFHSDGHLQMAVGNQLNEGHWTVTSADGRTGSVLIEWPDDAPETMRVRLDGGTLQIALDSVGNFAFRPAAR